MVLLRAYNYSNNSSRGRIAGLVASVLLIGALSLSAGPAHAAREADRDSAKQAREKVTALAAQDPETTSSIQTSEAEDVNCNRSRKRLWVEGEGWIVRRVTTCY